MHLANVIVDDIIQTFYKKGKNTTQTSAFDPFASKGDEF